MRHEVQPPQLRPIYRLTRALIAASIGLVCAGMAVANFVRTLHERHEAELARDAAAKEQAERDRWALNNARLLSGGGFITGTGTLTSTGTLLSNGAGNAVAYAGSTPTPCAPGQAVISVSLTPDGQLTTACAPVQAPKPASWELGLDCGVGSYAEANDDALIGRVHVGSSLGVCTMMLKGPRLAGAICVMTAVGQASSIDSSVTIRADASIIRLQGVTPGGDYEYACEPSSSIQLTNDYRR